MSSGREWLGRDLDGRDVSVQVPGAPNAGGHSLSSEVGKGWAGGAGVCQATRMASQGEVSRTHLMNRTGCDQGPTVGQNGTQNPILTPSPVIFPKALSCDKFQFQFQGGIWGQEVLTLCRRLAHEAAADQVYRVVRNWALGPEQVAPLSQEQFHWDGG